jgi:glucosamine-6-phosphate deaminase
VAFNGPPVADSDDSRTVKIVELEDRCRRQQVHHGCFVDISRIPTHTLTVTIPAIMRSRHIYCVVPWSNKSKAVARMLKGPISTECPASILRTHDSSILYLDRDAAMEL